MMLHLLHWLHQSSLANLRAAHNLQGSVVVCCIRSKIVHCNRIWFQLDLPNDSHKQVHSSFLDTILYFHSGQQTISWDIACIWWTLPHSKFARRLLPVQGTYMLRSMYTPHHYHYSALSCSSLRNIRYKRYDRIHRSLSDLWHRIIRSKLRTRNQYCRVLRHYFWPPSNQTCMFSWHIQNLRWIFQLPAFLTMN